MVTDLHFVTDLEKYTIFSLNGAFTATVFVGLALACYLFAVPHLERAAVRLRNALLPMDIRAMDYEFARTSRYHARFYALWTTAMGSWLSVPYLFNREDVGWFLTEAFTFAPTFGSATIWAATVIVGIFTFGLVALAISVLRVHGPLFGLILVPILSLIGLGCFVAGFFAGPYLFMAIVPIGWIRAAFVSTIGRAPISGTLALAEMAFKPVDDHIRNDPWLHHEEFPV